MFYFDWLQKGNPAGRVDRFPELKENGETSVPGIYCVGDLTGVPLIKLAVEGGHEMIERLHGDRAFQEERKANDDPDMLDLIIIGAGPAGVSAGICAKERGYRFLLVESSRMFNTLENFPKGKPIYVSPPTPWKSELRFSDGTKESLLEELHEVSQGRDLPLREGEMVSSIVQERRGFTVVSDKGRYKALRVIVAIGKSGNARMLGAAGEKLPKVFTRLIDPSDHHDQDILVVGGGDSAVEAAIALAEEGNRVTLSYRKASLSRPKEQNILKFERLGRAERLAGRFESNVKEIREKEVVLQTKGGEEILPNDAVYALIGTEIPIQFFRRSRIRMEGEKTMTDYAAVAALLLFSAVLYFGKKAPPTPVEGLGDFFNLPSQLLAMKWTYAVKGLLAWVSFLGMIAVGIYLLIHVLKNFKRYFTGPWPFVKYGFYASTFLLFGILYVAQCLGAKPLFDWSMDNWYTLFYSLAILIFGIRRMRVKPTGYIRRQTITLALFQWIPLFILPIFVFPLLGKNGMLPDWVMENVFPNESYWRAFGFVLAWPLFISNLAMGEPYTFWLVVCLLQTFVIIPFIVYKWGKGAYCGWVCSCGALAETLGDEYRTKAPHGPKAKKMDNWGQVVLWFAAAMTILVIAMKGAGISGVVKDVYELLVDIIFAGVLGVGVYFFLSGRVWCRFLCPLAALMHVYARFSPYRIMADKKRCISCNICTKVCHMGIDVMNFANKGIPMNDVECVRCSACIVNCPMQVLTFGRVKRADPENTAFREGYIPLQPGWKSGLLQKDIDMLLDEERKKHPELQR